MSPMEIYNKLCSLSKLEQKQKELINIENTVQKYKITLEKISDSAKDIKSKEDTLKREKNNLVRILKQIQADLSYNGELGKNLDEHRIKVQSLLDHYVKTMYNPLLDEVNELKTMHHLQ